MTDREAIESASIVTAIEQTITLIERGSINAKLISALLAECKAALSTLPIAGEGKVKALVKAAKAAQERMLVEGYSLPELDSAIAALDGGADV